MGLAVIVLVAARLAAADSLIDGLATDDPVALAAAVSAIEGAPPDADALFGAARACEDRLLDPARALALYDRILRDVPDARVAQAAQRRSQRLRAEIGPRGEHAATAAAFAQLVAMADRVTPAELIARGDALIAMPWPGASDVALFVADVLRRRGAFALAQARYADMGKRFPARLDDALRGGAGNAIDAHEWSTADRMIAELPTGDDADGLIRDNLRADLAAGRRADRLYRLAWLALAISALGLVASILEAHLRGGRRRPSLRPPIEVLFLAPVAVALTVVAFASRAVVTPAVAQICAVGIAATWLSGATLDTLRARGRRVRLRAVLHVLACAACAVAIGYIAIVHGGLVELLAETVQAGPSE
ncbi:MAG: hypothetical protein ABI175_18305 [Polyangiales bacterium]